MALTVLKNTNNETIVKISEIGTEIINLQNDILANTQALDNNSNQVVNIAGLEYTGLTGSVITVTRNGTTVTSLLAEGHDCVGLASGFGFVDTTENTSDIEVNIDVANAQCYLTLRKVSGYKTKVENATYGAYDDPNIVGASSRSGAPIPEGLFDLPAPGSGSFLATLSLLDTTVAGSPYAPGSQVSSISNQAVGLYRKKFKGNFATNPGATLDADFCRNTPGFFGKADPYVSFGSQYLDGEDYYTFEWTGYFKAPATGNYNFWTQSDDDTYFWIGSDALVGDYTNSNYAVTSSNTLEKTPNSLYLEQDMYYPVRMQFGEWGGAEHCQLFWAIEGSSAAIGGTNGVDGIQVWYHNSATKGI